MPGAHALLSASGSSKWLNCTPSAVLESQFPESTSPYAEEGTLAHEIAELMAEIGWCLESEKCDGECSTCAEKYLLEEMPEIKAPAESLPRTGAQWNQKLMTV